MRRTLALTLTATSLTFSFAATNYVSVTWGVHNDECMEWASNSTAANLLAMHCRPIDDSGVLTTTNTGTEEVQVACFFPVILGHGEATRVKKWTSALREDWTTTDNAVDCQLVCQQNQDCTHFTYFKSQRLCQLWTGEEVAQIVSTRVSDVVLDTYSGVPYTDPRWGTCDMNRARECEPANNGTNSESSSSSSNARQCLSCADEYRCVFTDLEGDAETGPALCSKYQQADLCAMLASYDINEDLMGGREAAKKESSFCKSRSLDVMFVQDATENATNIISFISWTGRAIEELLRLTQTSSDNFDTTNKTIVRVGLSTFKDKPVAPYGENDDYCFQEILPLTSDFMNWVTAYSELNSSGGGDEPNDQLTSLAAAAEKTKWRSDETTKKLIVQITNSLGHYPEPDMPFNTSNWDFSQADNIQMCSTQRYAAPRDLRNVLKIEKDVDAIFLTTYGQQYYYLEWLNEYLGQPQGYVQVLEGDGTNILAALSDALYTMLALDCKYPSQDKMAIA